MYNAKKVGEKLLALRGNTPREQIASAVNISVSALAMYELGERTPRDEVKLALAQHYGCSVGELFFEQ